jgi:hypothetical protein
MTSKYQLSNMTTSIIFYQIIILQN